MNCISIIGNLTTDPTIKTVNIQNVPTEVTNFSIAVNERGVKDVVTYFRCHAWRGLAKNCFDYLSKGRKVYLKGPVHLNSYKDSSGAIRYSMDIRVDEIEFLDKKPQEETLPEAEAQEISNLEMLDATDFISAS